MRVAYGMQVFPVCLMDIRVFVPEKIPYRN